MRGRRRPAAASFLRRRGEEGSGGREESRARRPRGGSRAGGRPGPVRGGKAAAQRGAGFRGRSGAARGRRRWGPGCHRRGRGAPALGPPSAPAVTAPPRAAGCSGPGALPGRAPPSVSEGGAAEGSPTEPPRRESRRSMAGAGSRRPPAPVPQFETRCNYVKATLEEFLAWSCGQPSSLSGPFSCYEYSKYWAYADYKYIARIFEHKPEFFQDIRWSDFGFPGRSGKESTLWIGSEGANTPCHLDSYGCNLVLQVQGRKRWHLFPPGDTSFLYPTRIPYEESSVFSKVNVANPDLKRFPEFRNTTAHIVTLSPGQVLLVPRHWWHYVESIDPVTVSINSWIELDADHEARVEEAITRMLVCAIKSAENPSDGDLWLNPTEIEATSHEINLQYLNKAVSAYLKCQKESVSEHTRSSNSGAEQRTSSLCKRKKREVGCEPEGCRLLAHEFGFSTFKAEKLQKTPFGLHLIQVLPQSQETSSMGAVAVESDGRPLLRENEEGHFGKLHCTRKQLVMSNDCEMPARQMDSDGSPNASQTALSTNDLLDCLVNPHVINLVARLLLERTKV
ncbi:HSPB1-associated protein 1 isoform X3 [Falco naumanni]|uniref:HSPB1-associated protein 1 isoform X3 n=1 Tax=Falco naumanni TaxID=148594 RepID=UPI001ADE3A73|nr:HSPB1-associated protein 1 isoform X3 [Falco naumanni]